MRTALIDFRFMRFDPHQLGRGEASQRTVARQSDQSFEADHLRDLIALCLRPLIVPQDRGAQYTACLIQHTEAVHLTRQADAFDGITSDVRLAEGSTDGGDHAIPPVVGVLFAPQRLRLTDRLRRAAY